MAYRDAGYTVGQISEKTSISLRTVADIVAGKGAWAKILEERNPVFAAYRSDITRMIHSKTLHHADKALDQVYEKLPEASAAQAAVCFGILFDKERLLSGNSTENISHLHRVELQASDDLAAKLAQALLAPAVK